MTTTVKIEAHCSDNKEVSVNISEGTEDSGRVFTLQNGEIAERYVYDERTISVREILKEA